MITEAQYKALRPLTEIKYGSMQRFIEETEFMKINGKVRRALWLSGFVDAKGALVFITNRGMDAVSEYEFNYKGAEDPRKKK